MNKMFFSLSFMRASSLVVVIGLAVFALAARALTVLAPDWAVAVVSNMPATALTIVAAAIIGQAAMSLSGAWLNRRQSKEVEQIRTAIDSMAQGLCMFDAAERLVVCNAQARRPSRTERGGDPRSPRSDRVGRRRAHRVGSAAPGGPPAQPGRHLVGGRELDDPGPGDRGHGEDLGEGLGRRLGIEGQNADGLAAGLVGGAADGHGGDVDAVPAEDVPHLADDAGDVAVDEDHQRPVQGALQAAPM